MIINQEEYYEAKKRLHELGPNRNNSPQERDEFDNLLNDISLYEVETGMINKNEFKDENTQ